MGEPKDSGVSRIVGLNPGGEEALLRHFRSFFEGKEKDVLDKEHSPELDRVIEEINRKLKDFLRGYGVDSVEVSTDNIHVIDPTKVTPEELEALAKRLGTHRMAYLPRRQQVVSLWAYEENKIRFAHGIVHELLHISAFLSYEKAQGNTYSATMIDGSREEFSLKERRTGFRINSPKGITYFHNIDESIIEELAIRFDWKYFSEFPELKDQFEERQVALEGIVKGGEDSMEELQRIVLHVETKKIGDAFEATVETPGYDDERKNLYALIEDLYEKNRDKFNSKEEVFRMFVDASFHGRLLPVARLVEATYGKGSFRKLGEETGKKT